jgi:hypothetical protein
MLSLTILINLNGFKAYLRESKELGINFVKIGLLFWDNHTKLKIGKIKIVITHFTQHFKMKMNVQTY